MTTLFKAMLLGTVLAAVFAIAGCRRDAGDGHPHADEHAAADAHGHGDAADEIERGPHEGRMLRHGDIAVELAIYEAGVPPEFRAWLWREGELLPPDAGTLEVDLARLGGRVDAHTFTPRGDYLWSKTEVHEPHSFDVEVRANVAGVPARWRYESYEGRTTIPAAIAEEAGIRTAPAGPGTIRDEHEVQGLLTPIEGRHAKIVARFPGPVRSVDVGVGDHVRAGQRLATVESNVSLSGYAVTAPLAGIVLARSASVGELAGDAPLFEVADLSKLWVDLHVFGADAQHITAGLPVVVTRLADGARAETVLDRVLPATATASQSTVARATLDNADGQWRPGSAVRARVTVAVDEVPLVVPLAALQRFRDWDVVYVRVGDVFEARPLELGRRDATHVEVLGGLAPGDVVVVEQSYVVKADIEKSGASHDH